MNPFDAFSVSTSDPSRPAFRSGGRSSTRDPDPDREFERGAPMGVAAGSLGYGSGGPVWLDAFHSKRPPSPPELVNAVKNVAFACITLNAKAFARVPLRLYAKTGTGQRKPRRSWQPVPDRTQRYLRGIGDRSHPTLARSIGTHDEVHEIVDHPLLEALERPNAFFDKTLFLQYICASLDAVGQAFLYPVRPAGPDGLADPTWAAGEIWPLQAQYVYPTKVMDGRLVGSWRYFADTYEHKELVRIRNWSLRDPYLSGYAPLHASYEQNGLVDYYTASVEGILKGGGRPDAVLTARDNLMPIGDAEAERYEREINKRYGGPNQGKIWVMRGAFDLHTLNYKPVDLGGLELTKEQRLLAANCFDVPIDMLESENSNRATASESTHKHQYYAIAPRCCLADAAFTHQLARPVDDRLFFAFDDPVSRDVERDAKVFDMKIKNRSATINEARADEGKPPVTWGDEPEGLVKPVEADPDPKPDAAAAIGKPTGTDVQKEALNGAQISSMVEVVTSVQSGVIPPASAEAILSAAFPSLGAALVKAIIGPIEVKPPPEPMPVPAKRLPNEEPAPEDDEEDDDDEGDEPETSEPEPPDPERAMLYDHMRRVLVTLENRLEPERLPGPGGDDPGPDPVPDRPTE